MYKHIITACITPFFLLAASTSLQAKTAYIAKSSDGGGILKIDKNSGYDEIIIPRGVTMKKRIHIMGSRTNDVVIRGESNSTSILAPNGLTGISKSDKKGVEGKLLSNIYVKCNGCTVSISNLKSRNPQKFHILGDSSQSKILANNLTIETIIAKNKTEHSYHTTDGFGGGNDSAIRNTTINTHDDSIKCYHANMNIENVTITHNKYGAPFQFGWGKAFTSSKCTLKGKNVVLDNSKDYRHGVFGWATTDLATGHVKKVAYNGKLNHRKGSAAGAKKGNLYTIGLINNKEKNKTVIDGNIELTGKNCLRSNANNTEYRTGKFENTATFSKNC